MANTGFCVNGVDIINMFELLGTSTPGGTIGYRSNIYDKDLSGIFKMNTSGTYASDTGYKFKNVSGSEVDISRYFEKPLPLTITPDVIPTSIDGDYLYRLTSTSYSVTFKTVSNVRYLVVAGGGGGGGNSMGSGGGAGGVLYGTITNPSSKSYTMSVGVGGIGMTSSYIMGNGGNSAILGEGLVLSTALGGGGGAGQQYSINYYNQTVPPSEKPASAGGSGAGATRWESCPGAGTISQGYIGGSYSSDAKNDGSNYAHYWSTGGGGGAGGVGGNGNKTNAGSGGIGISSNITGVGVYYGGGGGGSVIYDNGTWYNGGGIGGNGGGGNGGVYDAAYMHGAILPTSGVNGTGGGGGGGANSAGGNGGNGIIILRVSM